MKIHIYVNEVAGGWLPDDIDQFLGGGEEVVVLLAEALVRFGFSVVVYHNRPEGMEIPNSSVDGTSPFERHGVLYLPREKADFGKNPSEEILITFKDAAPFINGASVFRNIHFSSDVEGNWPLNSLNYFVHMSEYHASRNIFVPLDKSVVCPLGVDIHSLDKHRMEKVENTVLYCSSPDRGLVQLVQDWSKIKESNPDLKLRVAYGFHNYEANEVADPRARTWKNNLLKLIKDNGVEYLGQLSKEEIEQEYWKAEYWCLPLQRPDSELFCLNALKARYCGCIPIVNKIGALKDTVQDYIPYKNFVDGVMDVHVEDARYKAKSWDKVVEEHWAPLFQEVL